MAESVSLEEARASLLRGARHEYQCPAYAHHQRQCTCRASIKADALIVAATAKAVKPLVAEIERLRGLVTESLDVTKELVDELKHIRNAISSA